MTNIPRNEYPRPQLVREDWINLNGEWQFEIDNGRTGLSNIYHIFSKPEFCKNDFNHRDSLKDKIIVPFSPESKLSGIGNTDFMTACKPLSSRCSGATCSCKNRS